MLSLNNSKKFQNEFSEFEQKISKITEQKKQQKLRLKEIL